MAKNNNKKTEKDQVKIVGKPLNQLNTLFTNIMDTITGGGSQQRDKELIRLNDEVDDVIFEEIKKITSYTGDDASTFLVKLFNDREGSGQYNQKSINSIEELFSDESNGDIISLFNERYQNQNLKIEDLDSVCSLMYELEEAINATRDAIVTSDDVGQNISRTIRFKNASESDTELAGYLKIVENIENRFKLLTKMKNHIIPKSLLYGTYYTYSIPYSVLFQQYHDKKTKDLNVTMESVDIDFIREFKKKSDGIFKETQDKELKEQFDSILENISVVTEDVGIPLIEGNMSTIINTQFEKQAKEAMKIRKTTGFASEATFDPSKMKSESFDGIKDCYVKLIDPRKIIPVKIMDEVIGYYFIHEMPVMKKTTQFNSAVTFTNTKNTKNMENTFLSKIADKIVKSFDKPFLEENIRFKELILNSLIFHDIYNKNIKFQFIPKDYITEFPVNQDTEENGVSIIYKSLFYAKLYLAILIFKMISIIGKSNDQKIYYVKNSGLDTNTANSVQNVARSIKEKQLNFTDLLNSNSLLSKVGQAKDIFMPIGSSGERAIDFDILSGQDIQLNTELMEMLRSGAINATGVPSVIMNYINEADYSRTLVMANAKFTGRVVNYQMDYNSTITEFYKKILRYASDIPEDVVERFEFVLSPPKSMNTNNMTELINNTDQIISYMIKSLVGDNASSDDDNMLKDILYRRFAKDLLPMLPWASADEILKDALVEMTKNKVSDKDSGNE